MNPYGRKMNPDVDPFDHGPKCLVCGKEVDGRVIVRTRFTDVIKVFHCHGQSACSNIEYIRNLSDRANTDLRFVEVFANKQPRYHCYI